MDETIFLKECYILGTNHYDALGCWGELKIGVSLDLKYEEGKIYLYHSQYKIGYLSDEDAMGLIPYMKADQADIYNSCISYQDKEGRADENTRLKVVIRIKNKKNKKNNKKNNIKNIKNNIKNKKNNIKNKKNKKGKRKNNEREMASEMTER